MSKKSKPAILGGKPMFSKSLPITRPTLPKANLLFKDIKKIFHSGLITNSEYVEKLEKEIAKYLNVRYAVAVSSCTSGLILVGRSLGIKGEVLVPSFTFAATVQSLIWNNLKPVFVDCDKDTWNIDVKNIERSITKKTSAILAVYTFGNPPYPDQLQKVAKKYNLKLIFDAAHSLGAKFKGKPVGCWGDAEVFSLSPTKILVAGEGGIVATNNSQLYYKVKIGRDYGNPGNYNFEMVGLNARLPEFNAILGLQSLKMLDENVRKRNYLAGLYKKYLQDIPGIHYQMITPGSISTYKDFTIYISADKFGITRDELAKALKKENIDTRKYYYPPVHLQKFYKDLFKLSSPHLPVTEMISKNVLSLPLYSHLTEKEVKKVADAIINIHRVKDKIKTL